MKNRYWTAVLGILTVAALAVTPLRADENASSVDGGKSKPAMCKMDCGKDGWKGARGHEDFKKKLGLTDDQAKKFETIKQAERAEMDPLRDQIRTLSKKLEWQLSAKASDSDIKSTLDEAKSVHESMASSMKRFRTQMDDILTPTQQAKLLVMRSKMMEHGRWGHGGHGHHDGFEHHGDGEHQEQDN